MVQAPLKGCWMEVLTFMLKKGTYFCDFGNFSFFNTRDGNFKKFAVDLISRYFKILSFYSKVFDFADCFVPNCRRGGGGGEIANFLKKKPSSDAPPPPPPPPPLRLGTKEYVRSTVLQVWFLWSIN